EHVREAIAVHVTRTREVVTDTVRRYLPGVACVRGGEEAGFRQGSSEKERDGSLAPEVPTGARRTDQHVVVAVAVDVTCADYGGPGPLSVQLSDEAGIGDGTRHRLR